jgi:hypothetical protein
MEEALRVWERKVLRMVYDSKRDTNGWRIRTNKELQDQYRNTDVVTSIKVRRLEWAGHVVRMDGERMVKSVFGKPRRKKETRKAKVKMAGLCGGWPENIGSDEREEKGGRL